MGMKGCYARLSRKQRAVIEDMLKNGLTEYEAIEKNGVRRCDYRRWLDSGYFRCELNVRIEAALRQKLRSISKTEKGETARKACLDLIALLKADAERRAAGTVESEEEPLDISPEKASRMLDILAEDEK